MKSWLLDRQLLSFALKAILGLVVLDFLPSLLFWLLLLLPRTYWTVGGLSIPILLFSFGSSFVFALMAAADFGHYVHRRLAGVNQLQSLVSVLVSVLAFTIGLLALLTLYVASYRPLSQMPSRLLGIILPALRLGQNQ